MLRRRRDGRAPDPLPGINAMAGQRTGRGWGDRGRRRRVERRRIVRHSIKGVDALPPDVRSVPPVHRVRHVVPGQRHLVVHHPPTATDREVRPVVTLAYPAVFLSLHQAQQPRNECNRHAAPPRGCLARCRCERPTEKARAIAAGLALSEVDGDDHGARSHTVRCWCDDLHVRYVRNGSHRNVSLVSKLLEALTR